jgi:ligand-binding sensor domain-containing protein
VIISPGMIRLLAYFITLMLILAFSAILRASSAGQYYRLEKFTELEGLASSDINTILQDKRGYLWVGTGDGLSRYNGYEFISYTTEDGLNNNFIKALYQDDHGVIWIGTNQGLNTLDPRRGVDVLAESVHEGVIVTCIAEYGNRIVFGSNMGLHFIDENDSVNLIQLPRVRTIRILNERLFIGAAEGLYELNDESWTGKPITLVKEGISVRTSGVSGDSELIFGSPDRLWHHDGSDFKPLITDSIPAFDRISNVLVDKKEQIWVTADNGLSRILEDGTLMRFEENELSKACNFILQDYEGNIWVATQEAVLRYT